MKKTKEQLLTQLKKLEEAREWTKWIFPTMSLFYYSGAFYLGYLYYQWNLEILQKDKLDMSITAMFIALNQPIFAIAIMISLVGLYFFNQSIDAWIGSPEREAIITLLDEDN